MATMTEEARGPREVVYDEHISPLMAQIVALCKDAGIPIYASFLLDGDLACTTYIAPDVKEVPEDDREHVARFRRVHDKAVRGERAEVLAYTITSQPETNRP